MEEEDEIKGENKLNNLSLVWQLLEMVHVQPLKPERLVLFPLPRAGCLGLLACLWNCNLIFNLSFPGFLAFAGSKSFSLR